MITGVLYHNSSEKVSLGAKVAEAAVAHIRRTGVQPDTCYVHPTALPDGDRVFHGIAVRSSARVLRHHFWIGVENEKVPDEGAHSGGSCQPALFDVT